MTVIVTATVVVVLDQLTKAVALAALSKGPIQILPGAVTLRLTFNSGGAFGLGRGVPTLFLIATVAIIAFILLWASRLDDARLAIPLGMIVGGGAGNLVDRVARGFGGRVVDFVDVHVWPVFNLADSSIVVGVLLILIIGMRSRHEP